VFRWIVVHYTRNQDSLPHNCSNFALWKDYYYYEGTQGMQWKTSSSMVTTWPLSGGLRFMYLGWATNGDRYWHKQITSKSHHKNPYSISWVQKWGRTRKTENVNCRAWHTNWSNKQTRFRSSYLYVNIAAIFNKKSCQMSALSVQLFCPASWIVPNLNSYSYHIKLWACMGDQSRQKLILNSCNYITIKTANCSNFQSDG
jgi:hypothetical protein